MTYTSKKGRSILLRDPQASDLEALYEYAKKIEAEDTYILLNPQEPISFEEEKKYLTGLLKKIEEKKAVQTFVFHKHNMIGSCGVEEMGKRKHHVGRLGIALLSEYRGEGIGRTLIEHTLQEAQSRLQLKMVVLEHLIQNNIAKNLYEKVGFKKSGLLPKVVKYRGQYFDEAIMYKFLETEFENEAK